MLFQVLDVVQGISQHQYQPLSCVAQSLKYTDIAQFVLWQVAVLHHVVDNGAGGEGGSGGSSVDSGSSERVESVMGAGVTAVVVVAVLLLVLLLFVGSRR